MKLSIFWADILHYHAARVNALLNLASRLQHTVNAYSFTDNSLYKSIPSYNHVLQDRITIIQPRSENDGINSQYSKNQLMKQLQIDIPDVIAIIGYDSVVSRAALGWCRYHKKAAILMYESQEIDKPRVWWKELIKKQLVSLYDAALVGGKTHIDYLTKLGMPKERIFTKCCVVDNAYWSSSSQISQEFAEGLRKKYNLPMNYILSVGRLVTKKNFSGLIRSFAKYKIMNNASWDLVIVGDGELRSELKNLSTILELSKNIHFLGAMSADELAPIYGLASVFILPSIEEQWGLVINEAMSTGLPVMVSNRCGSSAELVIEGETGFSFDPLDEDYLAELMKRFSQNELDCKAMGQKAKQHIQNYSPEAFAQNLFNAAEIGLTYSRTRRWSIWPAPEYWF
jgi:1,2-diacylglycerol 3-alpha-glucosyltransferase